MLRMKKRLLLATGNPGKLGEMRQGLVALQNLGWELLSLKDLGIKTEPEETGKTFRENALLKARFYAELTSIPSLADDGGFVIPTLNFEPGVFSRRWLGKDSSDEQLIAHTLKKMQPYKGKDRVSYLELVLCFYDPQSLKALFENEKIYGVVASAPTARRIKGFPYRALLKVEPYQKYYDELTESEHHAVNHRLRALGKIVPKLLNLYA